MRLPRPPPRPRVDVVTRGGISGGPSARSVAEAAADALPVEVLRAIARHHATVRDNDIHEASARYAHRYMFSYVAREALARPPYVPFTGMTPSPIMCLAYQRQCGNGPVAMGSLLVLRRRSVTPGKHFWSLYMGDLDAIVDAAKSKRPARYHVTLVMIYSPPHDVIPEGYHALTPRRKHDFLETYFKLVGGPPACVLYGCSKVLGGPGVGKLDVRKELYRASFRMCERAWEHWTSPRTAQGAPPARASRALVAAARAAAAAGAQAAETQAAQAAAAAAAGAAAP